MRQIIALGTLCALNLTTLANVDFFGIARDLNDNVHLVKIDPLDATSMFVVAPLDVTGVSWLAYDQRDNTLVVHSDTQVFRVNPDTGETVAFANPAGVQQMQGIDFVTGVGLVTAFGPRADADKLGLVGADGVVSTLFEYDNLIDFDELIWDPVRDQIYVSATQQRVLYTIDEDTGDVLNTTNLPITDGNVSRASIHPETGIMYEVSFDQSQLRNTIYLRDPVSGERIGSIGTLPGFNNIHGLAFTPEPSSIVSLLLLSLTVLRRRFT